MDLYDIAAGGAGADEELPRWDLGDLYPGPEAPEIDADLAEAEAEAARFAEVYTGRLAGLDGAALAQAIRIYERIDEQLSRVMSYAGLYFATRREDQQAAKLYQGLAERVTDISSRLLFFVLELNRIDDGVLRTQLEDPAAARYATWIESNRLMRPHQLPEEQERLLHEKHVTGRTAWVRLYDDTLAAMRVRVDDRDLTWTEALNLTLEPDAEVRRRAALAFGAALDDRLKVIALVTNTLAKDKEIEDRWRRLPRPISSRNLANRVEDEVVDALVAAVRDHYARLSHRYYRLKAHWLGRDAIDYWERNAPLPDAPERRFSWTEARDTVLDAYARFSPDLSAFGRMFFERPWIDAPLVAGKDGGAFAHPTVPSAHPYLLVNFTGRIDDVMTLAHELGHGVHQYLAGRVQGHLLADTPLTLAETASVFGEMLTFQSVLAREHDPAIRRAMIGGKVEDMLNTVVRQIALLAFETRVHDERRGGELTPDRLGEIWLETQSESLGPAVRLDDTYRPWWAYISHFIHAPFYVYAYAFGDCLVNSLYAVYEESGEDFAPRYLDLLKAGGSQHHARLLAPFGLDARDPGFWARGLARIGRWIDELERDLAPGQGRDGANP